MKRLRCKDCKFFHKEAEDSLIGKCPGFYWDVHEASACHFDLNENYERIYINYNKPIKFNIWID